MSEEPDVNVDVEVDVEVDRQELEIEVGNTREAEAELEVDGIEIELEVEVKGLAGPEEETDDAGSDVADEAPDAGARETASAPAEVGEPGSAEATPEGLSDDDEE